MHTHARLTRSRFDSMIAGVAGGIAQYLSIDPVIVRLAFVLLAFSGFGFFIYPLLWLIIPREPEGAAPGAFSAQPDHHVFVSEGTPTRRLRINPMTGAPQEPEHEVPIQNIGGASAGGSKPSASPHLVGWIFIGLGAFITLKMLFPGLGVLFMPAVLIAVGIWLIRK